METGLPRLHFLFSAAQYLFRSHNRKGERVLNGKAKKNTKNALIAWGFLLPFTAFYTVYTIWPVIQGIYVSLHKWGLMGKQKFVGADNYIKFLGDKHFWGALGNTTKFALVSAPLIILLALALALMANRPTKLKKGLRVSYYMPYVLSVSVISFVFQYMFASHIGFVNGMLHTMGILSPGQEILWLTEGNLPWVVIVLATMWWTVGFSMMLYISALQDISPQIYEAANIDGASSVRQLFSITLPLLKRTSYLVVMLQVIAAFKVFGQIYMITRGGPGTATRPLIQYIYETAFTKNDLGYASAMSYALFLILIVLTAIQLLIQNRRGEA